MMILDKLYKEILKEYQLQPIDLLDINDEKGEMQYLENMGPTYMRTLRDVSEFEFNKNKNDIKILEIGSYLGFVSIGLKKLGFSVTASDLDLYMRNRNLQYLYNRYEILTYSIDLAKELPFNDNSFDCVIMCETLEHLNFNPVLVIHEIRRILNKEGYLYISVPNVVKLENRIKAIKGRSCYNQIGDYFDQLDPKKNFIVGLHWREYTFGEINELLNRTGFKVVKHYFFTKLDIFQLRFKFYFRALYVYKNFRYILLSIFKSLKENITIISQKQ